MDEEDSLNYTPAMKEDCPSPIRQVSALQNLISRMRFLKCLADKVFLWSGWVSDTRTVYAPLQTRAYSGGMWHLTWVSTPGRFFSVQQSTDGGATWITVAVAVPAADEPAGITSWSGPAMAYVDAFFRIVALPEGYTPCYNEFGIANIPGWSPQNDPLASLS